MREFGVKFQQGLRKGLRDFLNPIPGEEKLVECYNLMPAEFGLIPYQPILEIDFGDLISDIPSELTGLRAYWKLRETPGAAATYYDSIHDSDMTQLSDTDGDEFAPLAPGAINTTSVRATQLNAQQGSGQEGAYAPHTTYLNLNNTSFTISFWFRYSGYPSFGYELLRKSSYDVTPAWSDPTGKEWSFRLQGTGEGAAAFLFRTSANGTTYNNTLACNITSRTNVWHMVQYEFNLGTTTGRLRVSNRTDGFEAYTNFNSSMATVVSGSSPIVVANFEGTAEGTYNFDFADIGIWARVLTLAERQHLWNSGAGRTYPFL